MSQRPIFSRTPILPGAPRQPGGFILGAVVAVALFAILFPWFPGGPQLEEGEALGHAITAPRDHSYTSTVLTERERAARAAAVEPVLVLDTGIRDAQLAEFERIIGAIERLRADESLAESARETAIRTIPGASISTQGAAVLAEASDGDFTTMVEAARNALGRVLTGSIGEDGVPGARERAITLLAPVLSETQTEAVMEVVGPLVVPTLVVDAARTQQLREESMASTPPVQVSYEQGEVVVEAGRALSDADIEALEELGVRVPGLDTHRVVASGIVALLVGTVAGGYVRTTQPAALHGVRRLVLFALLLLVPAAATKFALPLVLPDLDRSFFAYALPLAAAPLAAAVLLDVAAAVLLAVLLAVVAGYVALYLPMMQVAGAGMPVEAARLMLTVLAASTLGLYVTARAERLQRYLMAGVAAGLAVLAVLVAVWLVDQDRATLDLPRIGAAALVNGFLTALIAVGAFVLLSRPFGIITRVELMELVQLSHPLLRRLQDGAPGSFQHSMLVGNMAERAADRIGADALLVRAGAYYHDVGKLVAPAFFIENIPEGEESPHAGLDPLQSTRVILQHVTGGIEVARREGLPEAIVCFIPEHHGTRLMTYFYRRAAEEDPDINPDLFRYPGPKPQSRETALVMIADSCEATVRASSDRSGQRIREIIDEIIRERIDEGQFDECAISLRDLRIAAETFAAALAAVYHPRVEYPQPTERERAQRRAASPPPGAEPPASARTTRTGGGDRDRDAEDEAAETEPRAASAREGEPRPDEARPDEASERRGRRARRGRSRAEASARPPASEEDDDMAPPSPRPAVPASRRKAEELHEDTT